MNLEKVKYPWLLAKHKKGGWEIELSNFEAIPTSQLELIYHATIKELNRMRTQEVREVDRARRARAAAEEAEIKELTA